MATKTTIRKGDYIVHRTIIRNPFGAGWTVGYTKSPVLTVKRNGTYIVAKGGTRMIVTQAPSFPFNPDVTGWQEMVTAIAAPVVTSELAAPAEAVSAFTYGLFNRPAMYGTVPTGFTNAQDNETFAYGTIDYPRRLTDEEIFRYELARVSPNTFDLPIGATVERLDAAEDGYTIKTYYRGRYILTHEATGDEEYSVKVSDVKQVVMSQTWYCNADNTPLVCWDGDEIWRCPVCDASEDEKLPTTIGYLAHSPKAQHANTHAATAGDGDSDGEVIHSCTITLRDMLEAIATGYTGDRTAGGIASEALEQLDAKDARIARLEAALGAVLALQPLEMSRVINENYAIGYNLALVKIQTMLAESEDAAQ